MGEGASLDDALQDTVELVRRFQRGERGAGEELFARLRPRVVRLVQLRIGPNASGRVEVDDVVQETLLATLQSIDSFEACEEARLVHWLARIAEHRVLQAIQAAAAERGVDAGEVSQSRFDPAADSTRVPDRAAREEERALVEESLQSLGPEHRDILLLREFAGCSWHGVVEELGYPTKNAAMKHYARARAALATALALRMRAAGRDSRGVSGAHDGVRRES